MQLTVRDVARLLKVDENAVYRWVKEDQLRAEEINGQYRFNRSDLLEWATLRSKLVFPPEFFQMGGGDVPMTLDMAHLQTYFEVRDRFVNTAAPPASTAVQISKLARDGALFEIEAIAVVPE